MPGKPASPVKVDLCIQIATFATLAVAGHRMLRAEYSGLGIDLTPSAFMPEVLTGLLLVGLIAHKRRHQPGPHIAKVGVQPKLSIVAIVFLICLGVAVFSSTKYGMAHMLSYEGVAWAATVATVVFANGAIRERWLSHMAVKGSVVTPFVVVAHPSVPAEQIAPLCDELAIESEIQQRPPVYRLAGQSDEMDAFLAFAEADDACRVVIMGWEDAEGWLDDVVGRVASLPIEVSLAVRRKLPVPDGRAFTRDIILHRPLTATQRAAKRCLDVTLSLALLVLFLPLMGAIALAVKCDSRGPVLFRQPRYGYKNKIFQVMKFRTMAVEQCDLTAERLTTRSDPRVTRVGRFLRRTSLDELPQLFNVLIGEMSIVGPRPHALNAKAGLSRYDRLVKHYSLRHRINPGITGLAQINGWRGATDTEEQLIRRVDCDLEYMAGWSLMMDLEIIIRTPVSLIFDKNAY